MAIKIIKFKNDVYLEGTILETGENVYGTYIKYTDGTLIQYGQQTETFTFAGSDGYAIASGGYTGPYKTSSFPIAFVDTSYSINVTLLTNSFMGIRAVVNSTTQTTIRPFSVNNTYSNVTATYSWIAIGKWK